MKIAIVGSRKLTNKEFIFQKIEKVIEPYEYDAKPIVILSGGAKGVDTLAYEWAKETGTDFVLFKPYHLIDSRVPYEPKYFFTRNKQIADNADLVVAFWDGQSSGTRHMIEYCERKHKACTVIEVEL